MIIPRSSRRAIGGLTLAVLIQGCAVPTQGDALGQSVPGAPRSARATAVESSGSLLYAADAEGGTSGSGRLLVFTYPQGKFVTQVTGFTGRVQSVCSDRLGNVFATTQVSLSPLQGHIYEYAHGGSIPIATLSDPGLPTACASDPTTGDLAIVNIAASGGGNVAIFRGAKAPPVMYSDPSIDDPFGCTFDPAGNLYIDGYEYDANIIGELPKGSSSFTTITLDQTVDPRSLQWYKNSLVMSSYYHPSKGERKVYEATPSGSTGIVTGPILLLGGKGTVPSYEGLWIQGNTIIGPDRGRGNSGVIRYWSFPTGGKARKTVKPPAGSHEILAVTVSAAK